VPSIDQVIHNSPADNAGLRAGWELKTVDGNPIGDIIDYTMACAEEKLVLTVIDHQGHEQHIIVEKEIDQDLGLAFASPTLDRVRTCANHCAFCFVDQMPPGMRPSLYTKDDDYRLSFLSGSYITLGNVRPEDISRIIALRLSPLYVSVHAYDLSVRSDLLRFPQQVDFWAIFDALLAGGIDLHCQIVACPGRNDGAVLHQTLEELYRRRSGVASVTVVPVGLTCYRQHLPSMRLFTSAEAQAVISEVEYWDCCAEQSDGEHWVWASDEFFLIAERLDLLPTEENYQYFPYLENGVGLIRKFWSEWQHILTSASLQETAPVVLITGVSGARALGPIAEEIASERPIEIRTVVNNFFGSTVTVTGLLTAQDILEQVPPASVANCLVLLPDVVLREGSNLFLDDTTLDEVQCLYREAGAELRCIPADAAGLYAVLFQPNTRRRMARRISR